MKLQFSLVSKELILVSFPSIFAIVLSRDNLASNIFRLFIKRGDELSIPRKKRTSSGVVFDARVRLYTRYLRLLVRSHNL